MNGIISNMPVSFKQLLNKRIWDYLRKEEAKIVTIKWRGVFNGGVNRTAIAFISQGWINLAHKRSTRWYRYFGLNLGSMTLTKINNNNNNNNNNKI